MSVLRAKYEPAMAIQTQKDADAYFELLVIHAMMDGNTRAQAEEIERSNLAYYAGYHGNATRARVERLFRCEHPIFGAIAEKGPPSPEEALSLGGEAARKRAREAHECRLCKKPCRYVIIDLKEVATLPGYCEEHALDAGAVREQHDDGDEDVMVCQFCSSRVGPDHFCPQMLQGMPIGERIGRRVLAIGPAEKARAREIIAYAESHPYRPCVVTRCPGDMPEHVMMVPFGIRCVYSLTVMPSDGLTYRHLSISLADAPERTAAPEITLMVAKELFAFRGLLPEWTVGLPDRPPPAPQVVTVVQLARAPVGSA